MSSCRRGRRRTRSSGNSSRELCDVTLEDLANSSVSSGRARLKKPIRNVLREVKSLTKATGSKKCDAASEHSEENVIRQEISLRTTRRRRKTPAQRNKNTGVRYPIDLWFLISDYIAPESVGKFARLCKDSLSVVQTAQFWFSLYKRYYKPGTALPLLLQPQSMAQRYGLRARVIRALHFMHRPLTLRCANPIIAKSTVCNRKVVRQWYQINLGSGFWTYFLKLEEINDTNKPVSSDLVESIDELMINREESCVIIQMECSQFVHFPLLMGMVLRDVKVAMGTIILGSHVQLKFTYSDANTGPAVCVDVVYIVSLNLINWWNPCYPHARHPLPCVTIADSE